MQGVNAVKRELKILLVALMLSIACASPLLAGCGSADPGDYEREVSELNETAAELREEASHHLAEEGPASGEEGIETLVLALEEVVISLREMVNELEGVKVPQGMEDFHHALVESYHSETAFYEGIAATLEPGSSHAEGENHADGEHDGQQEEENHADSDSH